MKNIWTIRETVFKGNGTLSGVGKEEGVKVARCEYSTSYVVSTDSAGLKRFRNAFAGEVERMGLSETMEQPYTDQIIFVATKEGQLYRRLVVTSL